VPDATLIQQTAPKSPHCIAPMRIDAFYAPRSSHVEAEPLEADAAQLIEHVQVEILERLARAVERRDDGTGHHVARVASLSARLARTLGLHDDEVRLISRAAALHDVGKISVPDSILLKPGRLDASQLERMRTHTVEGAAILSGTHLAVLHTAEEIALTHHERWDGSGYPNGLETNAIPLSGQIVALADVFDALTHDRPYKPAWSVPRALMEIERGRSTHFDPKLVDAFLEIFGIGWSTRRFDPR
jgi:putative two-component system response regulator